MKKLSTQDEHVVEGTQMLAKEWLPPLSKKRKTEGVTLIEVMIVVVILALLATAAGVALIPRLQEARIKATKADAQTIRSAVTMALIESPGDCPGIDKLVEAGFLDSGKRTTDAWDNDFKISCEGNSVVVTSAGPDGQMGTEDDIQ